MVAFFLNIFDYLQKRRWLCYGLMAGLTLILLVMVASLRYNENIYDFLPLKGNEQKAITLYQDISGGQRVVAMFKMKDGVVNTDRMTEAVDTFASRIQSHQGSRHVAEITTQVDFEKIAGLTDFIYQNIPMILQDSDYVRMARVLSDPESVNEQLANDVQMIMMPGTGFFSSNIGNDPLGLFAPVIDRMQAKQSSLPIEIDDGYIYSPGQQYAIAMMTSPYGAMESANNALLVEFIDSVAQQTMAVCPDVEVAYSGAPVIAVGNARQIKRDSQWAISISVTLILLLLVLSFRKVKNLFLIGVSIVFGWLFAMGIIAIMRSDVSLIVIGIGSMIIGIAVNYPLHFVAHTDHGDTVREVLKEMVSPLLIGNITTVGAFASLMPLDAPALRDLGFFAAFMLVGTILFVLVFLPHLVKKRAAQEKECLLFGAISSMSPERHRWLIWGIFLLTFVFGYYSLGITFDTNMHHINYMTDQQKELLSSMNASAGINDTANVYIVTEGDNWDHALQGRQQVATLLEQLKNEGLLNNYSDVTSFICSTEEQIKRINRWNAFWDKHRQDVYAMLQRKAREYGFNEEAFKGFVGITSKVYSPQSFDYFEPIRSVLFGNSFSSSTGQCSVVDVITADKDSIAKLENVLNEKLESKGYAFDFASMNSAVASSLSNDFNYIGFACGIIVFVFLWISFGRLELSILAFLPMALGWIWILGVMSMLGMQFNIVNVILATFIFGQGDDYTIFITDGLINEYAYRKKLLPSYKNSIFISALIMFIGMGSLIIARHPALHSLAEVTIVGMFTVVLMAWVVPPFVFEWLTKSNKKIRRVPVTIEQIVRTLYCAIVYIAELCYGSIIGMVVKFIPDTNGRIENWFHRLIYHTMRVDVNHIWGVRFGAHNEYSEDFSKGSIIICNHQSMLDPIYILSLNPRILVMVGNRVWKNPIVKPMFKVSRFFNAGEPVEVLEQDISRAVRDGYSVVIFPEGLRSDDKIMRFHKGAFYLADRIGADILPLFIHGVGHVMPKGSGLTARGKVDIEIGARIPANQIKEYGVTHLSMANAFHQMYLDHYQELKRKWEDSHYFHDYIIYKYMYKGFGVEKETRSLLKKFNDFSQWIDHYSPMHPSSQNVSVINAGKGQFSLLFALVHPEIDVYSYSSDFDDVALAQACFPLPPNLHISYCEMGQVPEMSETMNLIDFSEIIRS